MSNISIRFRPLNVKEVTSDVEDAIKRGITNGGGTVVEEAKDKAKGRIRRRNAISSGALISSFETSGTSRPAARFFGEVVNTADHARPVERGSDPGSYEQAPPAINLLPWVVREMQGFKVPAGWTPDQSTVESAQASESWADVTLLADSETIRKVFWLQEHIQEHGTDPVHFMRRGRRWAERDGSDEVATKIAEQLRTL